MFGGIAIGIGIAIIFLSNQGAGTDLTPPTDEFFIQQDGAYFTQQDGSFYIINPGS